MSLSTPDFRPARGSRRSTEASLAPTAPSAMMARMSRGSFRWRHMVDCGLRIGDCGLAIADFGLDCLTSLRGLRPFHWMDRRLQAFRYWFYAAAAYNVLWGLVAMLFPLRLFVLMHIAPPNYPALFQCIG